MSKPVIAAPIPQEDLVEETSQYQGECTSKSSYKGIWRGYVVGSTTITLYCQNCGKIVSETVFGLPKEEEHE